MTKSYMMGRHRHPSKLFQWTNSNFNLEEEQSLYGASIDFVKYNKDVCPIAANITQCIISCPFFEDSVISHAVRGYHPVIDTKVALLMPGQYPSIPGWHCDGVIRKDKNSQPDLSTLSEPVQHFVCTVSDSPSGHCGTEFISSTRYVWDDIHEDTSVWQQLDKSIEQEGQHLERLMAGNGEVVQFYRDTAHRCQPAKVRQFRMFYRMSFYHMPAMNRFRKQVNVYSDINSGW